MALCMRDHQHRAIYFYGEYEPGITALLRRFARPGWMVFDVGANAGYFSILAAELGATVHAFEPNPSVRALLARSVRLGSQNIQVVAAACSDQAAKLPFFLSEPGNTGLSSLDMPTDRRIEVDVLRLDDYASSTNLSPDLIKVDVEGHEREVLAGARALLNDAQPIVIAETSTVKTIELMRSHEYVPWRIAQDGSTMTHDGCLELVGGYENICFMPSAERSAGVPSQFTMSSRSVKSERLNGPNPVTENTS